MNTTSFKKYSFYFLIGVTVAIWALLIWEHFHGGVPSHSLFARKDMPAISNWWGGLLLPLLTFFGVNRIQKRFEATQQSVSSIIFAYLIAFVYALTLVYFYYQGNETVTGIMFLGLFVLGLIFPLYRMEFFLGFVMGLTYNFGTILPSFISSIVVLVSFIAHRVIYPFIMRFFSKKNSF